jgi:hypothetical protein
LRWLSFSISSKRTPGLYEMVPIGGVHDRQGFSAYIANWFVGHTQHLLEQ